MKEGIHPDYHTITVVMTDGSKYETRSTWGKQGDVLQLDVDPKTHPAWVGGVNLRKTGQMEKFANKFAFLDKTPAARTQGAAEAATPAAKKEEKKADVKKADAPKKEAKEGKKEAAPKAEAPKAEAKQAAPKEEKKN